MSAEGSAVSSPDREVAGSELPAGLARPFKVIAFDWDGTAVASRTEDAGPVRDLLEPLLRAGVSVVVITGTNFPNIDRQLSAAIRGPHKRSLHVATNRGSEVYGFDPDSRPALVWQRTATAEEDRRLTEIADAVRDALVSRTGLDIRVIYDRLNRRKIDLIPLPEWHDPPKAAIGELLRAVQARLQGAGLAGGLREVVELAERTAREKGLPGVRITTDVKHVEVGLTDKADAIEWLMRELVRTRGIRTEEVLIAGDEFGPIAGFEGSDHRMAIPEARGAVLASVGSEPSGVPAGVIHLGGGPARFRELLASQVALHQSATDVAATATPGAAAAARELPAVPTADPSWLLVEEGFNLAREHEVESLFAVANGYVGTRGSLAEGTRLSAPATYVAGVFDVTQHSSTIPELVLASDWTRLRIEVAGQELLLEVGDSLVHRRILDLRQGVLWREWRHRDPAGRVTRLRSLRLASLADRHVLLQSLMLLPENYTGRVHLEGPIELGAGREGPAAPERPELVPAPPRPAPTATRPAVADAVTLQLRTSRGVTVALALASRLRTDEGQAIERAVESEAGRLVERWEWEVEVGRAYRFDRLVAVHTSREDGQPAEAAVEHLERLRRNGVQRVVEAHTRAWADRWAAADVQVDGDGEVQRALRFAIYHLVSAANPADERVSIGARSLTGEAYKGHVFWDTEIYMLPFYTFTHPPAARALLLYRSHTLPAAREKARRLGYRGALYAWESTDSGEETTPSVALTPDGEVVRILTGEQEHHISADVAYAVWQYWQASSDDRFFVDAGAEIVLETARFWASRGQLEADGRYHIRRVIGPDEYHEAVDDNAYTNGMAQWNLERGAETARILAERWPERWRDLAQRLEIAEQEPEQWLQVAAAVETGFDPRTGLFEQFRGYFGLEDIDLAAYEPRTVPMDVLLGRERIQRSQVIKQADVVLLIYLLWDRFPPEVREANFRYYEPRTGHGSSLSPAIHALVAARLGDVALAERYFRQAAAIDLGNNMGNAAGGVHTAALGGLWQAAVFGLAGTRPLPDGLQLEPNLPPHWRHLRFPLHWKGRRAWVTVGTDPPIVEATLEGEGPATIALAGGEQVAINPGRRYLARRDDDRWGPWQEASGEDPADLADRRWP